MTTALLPVDQGSHVLLCAWREARPTVAFPRQNAQITLWLDGTARRATHFPKRTPLLHPKRERVPSSPPSAAAGLLRCDAAALAGPHGRAARARGHGLGGHALLDGRGHGHEGLFHVGRVLGARLQEGDADLVSKRLKKLGRCRWRPCRSAREVVGNGRPGPPNPGAPARTLAVA